MLSLAVYRTVLGKCGTHDLDQSAEVSTTLHFGRGGTHVTCKMSYIKTSFPSAHSKPLKMFRHTFKSIPYASINLVGQREKLTRQMPKLAGKCPMLYD